MQTKKKRTSRLPFGATPLLSTLAVLVLSSCSDLEPTAPPAENTTPAAETLSSAVPRAWYGLVLSLTKSTPGFTPPVASRAFGYTGVALYEAVRPTSPGARSFLGILNGLSTLPTPPESPVHAEIAANAALGEITRLLYANATDANQLLISQLEENTKAQLAEGVAASVVAASHDWGHEVAAAVFAWSLADGGHAGYLRNFPASYVPPTGPGLWVPTPPAFQAIPLQPYWGANRPLFLPATGNPNIFCDPGPPLAYSTSTTSPFYEEAAEVRSVGLALTTEQKLIADFWADGGGTFTPPGHWISIATQALAEEGSNLALASKVYALTGIALNDAFISCWYSKYQHNLLRPVSYIRAVIGDASWSSYIATPPFPEYTSGHSTCSGAASAVLAALFGGGYAFTDESHVSSTPSFAPRSFGSFSDAAEEAALSRLYGGIHFRAANERGLEAGRKIGAAVAAIPLGGHL